MSASKNERDELDRLGLIAQLVGVGDAAGQDQAVVIAGIGLGDRPVGLEGVALVEVVEGLDRFLDGGDQVDLSAGLADGPGGLGQLDLLDALVGDEEGDPLAGQLFAHFDSSFGWWIGGATDPNASPPRWAVGLLIRAGTRPRLVKSRWDPGRWPHRG